jgi:hypothetical protein
MRWTAALLTLSLGLVGCARTDDPNELELTYYYLRF